MKSRFRPRCFRNRVPARSPSSPSPWRHAPAAMAIALLLLALSPSHDSLHAQEPDVPALTVETLVSGLNIPWDLAFAPDRTMLFTQRGGVLSSRLTNGEVQTITADLGDLHARGETGLMAIVVDPAFSSNRRFYTCQGHAGPEVQVIAWTIDATYSSATRVADPLVGGIPAASGGRHGGCRLRFGPDGYLWIATGDATIGTAPQNLASLGGKVLRVNAATGAPAPGNPFDASPVYTYGHRNVQGLALRPGTSQMWSAEHGPSQDDEINLLVSGGNYGWNPVPNYNESVSMTDLVEFPAAVAARWSSGSATLATSGAVFLEGAAWGAWQGRLAVASLKNSSLRLFAFTDNGTLVSQFIVPELRDTYGRLRTPMVGPDGALYVTTANGGNSDRILKVTPSTTPPPPPPPPPPIAFGGPPAPSGPTPLDDDFAWNVTRDIDALDEANVEPTGLWSDGETLWLAHNDPANADAVFAYDLETGERREQREFALDEENRAPRGLCSEGTVIWVSDSGRDRLFAYDLESGERVDGRDLTLDSANENSRGIWCDEETMWVLNDRPARIHRYDLGTGEPLAAYPLHASNNDPHGIWSDGVTLWVSDGETRSLLAYRVEGQQLTLFPGEEFRALGRAGNNSPRGIWSDGDVMLVADWNDDRIYTYNMPDAADARLASLSLTGVEIAEFSSRRREYTGIPESGVRETTVAATAVQPSAMVALHPPAAGSDADNGHQVTISGGATITVTVTSPDGSRERVYRVHIEKTEEVVELTPTWTLVPWPGLDGVPIIEALRGAHPDLDITSHVVLIYHWDQASQTWRAFSPDLLDVPGLGGLATLTTGSAYWVAVTKSVTWTVPIAAPGSPP